MKKFNEYIVSEEVTYEPATGKPSKTSAGHTIVGHSWHANKTKHANIVKHGETGKYFAAGGSSSHPTKNTTFHDTPEAAAKSKKSYMKEAGNPGDSLGYLTAAERAKELARRKAKIASNATPASKAFVDKALRKEDIAVCSECGEAPCNCDDSHGFVSEAANDHYAEAEAHLNKASKALETSDMAAHHFHMSNHHEAKGQWHESKGRHSAADREYAKAEEHHEKSMEASKAPSRTLKSEETELGDLAHAKKTKHRVLVTYSDPKHTMVSKRKELQQKHVRVPVTHKNGESVYQGDAEHAAKVWMKKQGYKVHDAVHAGLVKEEVEQVNELSSDTLQSYKEKAKKSADELTAKGEHGKSLDRTMFRMRATGKQIDKTTASIKKALNKEEVDLEEAHKIGSSVEVIAGSGKGIKGHIGEIRHGAFKGAPKTYTVFHGDKGAIQVSKEHIRAIKEGVKSPGIGWMLKQDPKLKAIVDTHKEKMKEFKAFVGTKAKAEDKK